MSENPSSTAEASTSPSLTQTPEERLHALEHKMAAWKEAVAAQLNDAARKNKKLREELRVLREEKEIALSALRVQLTEEFHERTSMQREELAELTKQAALLREEKKVMAAAHEVELQKTRVQLRDVIQLEVETHYKRKEEQWEKEKALLQTRVETKETERAQMEHECEVMKVRLSRLAAQYEELASLLQSDDGTSGSSALSPTSQGVRSTSSPDAAPAGTSLQDAARQQTAVSAAFTQQLEAMKAELQSKEQHTQFILDRAKQEYEAEKAQLLRELQLREEELKVAHTLLKQVQAESSGYLQRVSHAQTERQALEQRYAAKIATLSEELTERMRAVDEAQAVSKRLQDQLRTAQQQVATLEEESTMREEAIHSLMLSEDNKRLVMDLQRAVQVARDEAEGWKMQYYAAISSHPNGAAKHADGASKNASGTDDAAPSPSLFSSTSGVGTGSAQDGSEASLAAMGTRTPQAWQKQLAAREASLEAQAAQLTRKAHLLEAAEAKLNDMRRSMASQASLLLQQQKSSQRNRSSAADSVVFRDGEDGAEDVDRDMLDASPLISTAASLLPSALHGSLRTLEIHRRRLHLPGSCRCFSCCFSGGGTSGAPLRLRRNPVLFTLMALVLLVLIISLCVV
jgi:hypothetical protein